MIVRDVGSRVPIVDSIGELKFSIYSKNPNSHLYFAAKPVGYTLTNSWKVSIRYILAANHD